MKWKAKIYKILGIALFILINNAWAETLDRTAYFSTLEEIKVKFKKENYLKHVVFIEPWGSTVPMIKRGLEKNYKIIILTAEEGLRHVPDALLQDPRCFVIKVDTFNTDKVAEALESVNAIAKIDAIIPGFEFFVPISATMAKKFQVPGIEPEYAWNVRLKDNMRNLMQKRGLATPKFVMVEDIHKLDQAIDYVGLPVICKPVDAAGSVNVKRADNRSAAVIATKRILENNDDLWGLKIARRMLAEEFINGKEFSVEGVVQNGKVTFLSVTEKLLSDEYDFVEVGHISNPPLPLNLVRDIHNYVVRTIHALNLDHAPFHAELRVTPDRGPILMEIAGRLAGDRIGEIITRSTGINFYDIVYNVYLGEKIPEVHSTGRVAGIKFFFRPLVAQISNVEGLEQAKALKGVDEIAMTYPVGSKVAAFPSHMRRMGYVIASGTDYDRLKKTLFEVDEKVKIR